MIQSPNYHRGFTLIEVLVAVLVFGLLAAITYGGLNTLTQTSSEQQQRAAEFAELQRVIAALDRDLRQLASRPVRRPDNSVVSALIGGDSGLIATRAGWANPGDQRRSQLQRFEWQLQGVAAQRRLVRRYWPVTDAAFDTAGTINLQSSGIQTLGFRYRDALGRWHTRWPVDAQITTLPSAIEYRLQSERFGQIRRLLLL